MTHPTFSEKDSLRVIQEMIAHAKKDAQSDRFYYLIWGWLTLIASLGHFVLLKVGYAYPYLVWSLMLLGGVATVLRSRQHQKTSRVKTYVDRFIAHLWIAISAGILVSLAAGATILGYQVVYPFLIILFGIGIYMSGVIFRFRPLIIGGILNWVIALTAFYVSFDIQLLLLALSMVVSYLIPGYLEKAS
ncbi:MAG: hypothetical protein ACLFT3_11730 [Cyclobacteriaceae bacterium]